MWKIEICHFFLPAWNKKIGKIPFPPLAMMWCAKKRCSGKWQFSASLNRGFGAIAEKFPIFLFQAGRKKWQISIFHIYVLCEKNVFGKKLSFFVIFLISIFRFFLCENNIMQKNVIFTHKKCHYLSLLICGSCRIMVWMQHFRVQSSTFVANSTPPEGGGKPNSLVLAGGWGRGVGVWGGGGFVAVRHPKVASH